MLLKPQMPKGRVSGVMGIIDLLHSKFGSLEIEINAAGGEMSKQDYEDKVRESLRHLGIDFRPGRRSHESLARWYSA